MSRCLLTEVRSGCVKVTTVLYGRASDCKLIDSDETQLYIGDRREVGLVDRSLRRVNAEGGALLAVSHGMERSIPPPCFIR